MADGCNFTFTTSLMGFAVSNRQHHVNVSRCIMMHIKLHLKQRKYDTRTLK